MYRPGLLDDRTLPSGRFVEFWDGGDPAGHPVIVHGGTPDPREAGRFSHRTALAAGARLICLNRPGYGGTTPADPSIALVAQDAVALAAELGLLRYAVVGVSGGGPFAVATAAADPVRVDALGVVGGVGPWRLLEDEPPSPEDDPWAADRPYLALLDAGDLAGAVAGFVADAAKEYGSMADMDDEARLVAFMGTDDVPALRDPEVRDIIVDEINVLLDSFQGYAFDRLAWGGPWDVDPRDVAAPTTLWYGTEDTTCPPVHGRWLAERITGAELRLLDGEDHVEVCMTHRPEVYATILGRRSEQS